MGDIYDDEKYYNKQLKNVDLRNGYTPEEYEKVMQKNYDREHTNLARITCRYKGLRPAKFILLVIVFVIVAFICANIGAYMQTGHILINADQILSVRMILDGLFDKLVLISNHK